MQHDESFVLDILKSAEAILRFKKKITRSDFNKNELVQSGVLHQLIVIGEAVKRLSPDFRKKHPAIPWKLMAGMRDRITHGYFDVDLDEVWQTIATDIPKLIKSLRPISPKESFEKMVHPWRPCQLGKHWVSTHPYHVRPSKVHPDGSVANQGGHCRANRSKKDQLFADDIQEIARRHFSLLKGPPRADDLGFKKLGNKFDELIRGWTQYWNEVLHPKVPLDPDLVKALIASESGFDIHASNHLKGDQLAQGLMQVTNGSVKLLSERSTELKDHFVNLSREDMEDPNLAICAGIRWLFRKKQIADSRAGDSVSWREAVLKYKDYASNDPHMKKFDDGYARLKRK